MEEPPLPNAPESEWAVLACLLGADSDLISQISRKVGSHHFFAAQNQALFRAILDRFEADGYVDSASLKQHLKEAGQLSSVGGPARIDELESVKGGCDQWSHHAEILRNTYAARMVIRASLDSIEQARRAGVKASDLFAAHDKRFEAVRRHAEVGHARLPALCDMSQVVSGDLPPEPAELVRGVLHQGSKLIVGGTSKGRKTMALIDLSVSVATGAEWWGFKTTKGPVCYINFEIQDSFFARRVHAVCEAKQTCLEPGTFWAWNLRGHGEGIERLTDDLLSELRHRQFVLVVVDPIYKALGRRDENKAGDVASMLNELERIAVRTGAAVAFGAHYSKGNQSLKESIDRIGGSGVFARDPDSILTMTAHEEEECFTVEATLRNFAPLPSFVVRWEWPLFSRMDELDPSALKPARGSVSAAAAYKPMYTDAMLLDHLSVANPVQVSQLRKLLDELYGMKKSEFYRRKDRLVAEGKIKQCGRDLLKSGGD